MIGIFPISLAAGRLTPTEQLAIDLLGHMVMNQTEQARACRRRLVAEEFEGTWTAIVMWCKVVAQLADWDTTDLTAECAKARANSDAHPDSEAYACTAWCLAVLDTVIVGRSKVGIVAVIAELEQAQHAPVWVETLLRSAADTCRRALQLDRVN